MSQELLEGRWDETKDALLEGLNGSKRSSMSVILENTKKYLRENASTGSTSSGGTHVCECRCNFICLGNFALLNHQHHHLRSCDQGWKRCRPIRESFIRAEAGDRRI